MIEFFNKLKLLIQKDKKLLILLIAGALGICLIAVSELVPHSDKKAVKEQEQSDVSYEQKLEERLCSIVGKIKGVGNVSVMINTKGTEENELAQNSSSNRNSQGDIKSENEYVLVGSQATEQGVLIKKNYPEIQGVIIVCDGGDDIRIQNEVINAVSALLGISKNNVAVLKMKYTEEKQ